MDKKEMFKFIKDNNVEDLYFMGIVDEEDDGFYVTFSVV